MPEPTSAPATAFDYLIPLPTAIQPGSGKFILDKNTRILISPDNAELRRTAEYLAGWLQNATGYALLVETAGMTPLPGNIWLTMQDADETLGAEGYTLSITQQGVRISANQPAGVFYGGQTLRQLLPAASASSEPQLAAWELPTGEIRDLPRFAWRGMMLDVARHFFGVKDIQRVIDWMAMYKLNRLHLHLTDDQGWRIEIQRWPRLAVYGGSTEVGGGRSGFYTQTDYSEIVAYAQNRYITIVPEIDLPGHTNAALAAYPELNCDDSAPPLYTGIEVGFSSLCVHKEITYQFLEDVMRELAALTPGPYIHIGGDEAAATPKEDYMYFVDRIQGIVRSQGKQVIGWEEIAQASLLQDTLVQHWHNESVLKAVAQGNRVILSPASRAYLDMKYDETTPFGLSWAGFASVEDAYTWDPATLITGVPESAVIGIEAALWSETLQKMADIEYMVFPRLAGLAEIGWSPADQRNWEEYRLRLAAHGLRWQALQINFYPAPEIPWE